MTNDLHGLRDSLRSFVAARDWAQFHSPKSLACSLVIEASELLERFQWLTDEQSRQLSDEQRQAVAMEVGDVLIYLVEFCDLMGIEPLQAAREKLAVNERKYPVERARGNSRKYTEL